MKLQTLPTFTNQPTNDQLNHDERDVVNKEYV